MDKKIRNTNNTSTKKTTSKATTTTTHQRAQHFTTFIDQFVRSLIHSVIVARSYFGCNGRVLWTSGCGSHACGHARELTFLRKLAQPPELDKAEKTHRRDAALASVGLRWVERWKKRKPGGPVFRASGKTRCSWTQMTTLHGRVAPGRARGNRACLSGWCIGRQKGGVSLEQSRTVPRTPATQPSDTDGGRRARSPSVRTSSGRPRSAAHEQVFGTTHCLRQGSVKTMTQRSSASTGALYRGPLQQEVLPTYRHRPDGFWN